MRHSRSPHLCYICTLTGLWLPSPLAPLHLRARCSGQIPAWRKDEAVRKDKDLAAPLIESYVFVAPSYDELKEWVWPRPPALY